MRIEVQQGSQEWLSLRKKKITATDAGIILGINPWKTKQMLWQEKVGLKEPDKMNEKMARGISLEPIALDAFCKTVGYKLSPTVLVHDSNSWAMASLDGMSENGQLVEIKCGQKSYEQAKQGVIPDYYYSQMQHQMYVAGVKQMSYFCFNGEDGICLDTKLCQDYVDTMLHQEQEFYRQIIEFEPPELTDKDYLNMENNKEWKKLSLQFQMIKSNQRSLEELEQKTRQSLLELSKMSNAKGCGITVKKVILKGRIQMDQVPEDIKQSLEIYRSKSTESFRII